MLLKADCVNPNMVSLLSRVGFKVKNIFGHHTIMVYQ
jgi:hypothetical protein